MQIKSLIIAESFSSIFLNIFIKKLNSLTGEFCDTKTNIIRKKIKRHRFTLLKSPHVHKKAREQFEKRIFQTVVILKSDNKSIEQLLKKLKTLYFSNVIFKIQLIKKG
jgi:ribosomal protein S10